MRQNCYILAVMNQKGGTGKTATAAALAEAAREDGKKTLLVDFDPQASLSISFGANTAGAGSYALLTGERPAAQLIVDTAAGDLIPGSWSLAAATTSQGSARRLQKALEPLEDRYDLIIVDVSPQIGELQYNTLQAADGLIIPVEADVFALHSLYQLMTTVKQIQRTNKELNAAGIVVTKYDGRSTLSRQMLDNVKRAAAALDLDVLGTIRKAIAVSEAAALQRPLLEYAPKSKPAQDYRALYKTLKEVLSW